MCISEIRFGKLKTSETWHCCCRGWLSHPATRPRVPRVGFCSLLVTLCFLPMRWFLSLMQHIRLQGAGKTVTSGSSFPILLSAPFSWGILKPSCTATLNLSESGTFFHSSVRQDLCEAGSLHKSALCSGRMFQRGTEATTFSTLPREMFSWLRCLLSWSLPRGRPPSSLWLESHTSSHLSVDADNPETKWTWHLIFLAGVDTEQERAFQDLTESPLIFIFRGFLRQHMACLLRPSIRASPFS